MNLLKNCMEYSPAGGTVHCSYGQNELYTEILIGMREGFQRGYPPSFWTVYCGQNAKNGIGIGLSLQREIIERQTARFGPAIFQMAEDVFEIRFYSHWAVTLACYNETALSITLWIGEDMCGNRCENLNKVYGSGDNRVVALEQINIAVNKRVCCEFSQAHPVPGNLRCFIFSAVWINLRGYTLDQEMTEGNWLPRFSAIPFCFIVESLIILTQSKIGLTATPAETHQRDLR